MRFSRLFAPTAKESPKDAVLSSHALLLRAGFIEQLGSGLYNFLPLGQMLFDSIRNIVKEEMDASGAQHVNFSFVTPADLWRESGRYSVFGKELLRFKDRKENDFVLSATNEESVVNMVKNRINSYKQLPVHLYQINTKFRDEARPRFGLLRGREFVMKDGYSFHANQEDLKREFDLMYETYSKIFTKLGLNFRAVDADSGAIGGSGSKEFMVLADNGEDDIVVCSQCEYAANIEAAKRAKKVSSVQPPEANMMSKFHTPNLKTIDEIVEFFKTDAFYTIKAIIKKAIYDGRQEIVIFFIRGCDELQEVKALNACGALELEDASEEEIRLVGIESGFCGPINLPEGIQFYIDSELEGEKNMICGANEKNYHIIGFNVVSFKDSRFKDLIAVNRGDKCQICGSNLDVTKGIEVGHIFQLGQKYSSSMNATFLNENGKATPFYMGCYGIGVSRLMAVMVEANHDEKGCIWNKQTAPFILEIIISNAKDIEMVKFGEEIYGKCKALGIKVLLDDRNERFGVKMNDFELIGFPYALLIGKRLNEGEVEFIQRDGLKKDIISKDDTIKTIKERLC